MGSEPGTDKFDYGFYWLLPVSEKEHEKASREGSWNVFADLVDQTPKTPTTIVRLLLTCFVAPNDRNGAHLRPCRSSVSVMPSRGLTSTVTSGSVARIATTPLDRLTLSPSVASRYRFVKRPWVCK